MPTSSAGSHRAWLMVGAGISLLAGLDGALLLLGVWSPVMSTRLSKWHGPLMVLGFVGTVICLERAVALGHRLAYLVPAMSGFGVIVLLAPLPFDSARAGLALLTLAQLGLLTIYVPLWRRSHDDAVVIQGAGAFCAAGAAALLTTGAHVSQIVGWLACYMILTICGERLELSRLTMARNRALSALCLAVVAALLVSVVSPAIGWRVLGVVLIGLAVWLCRHDVARGGLRRGGQAAYIGTLLMIGYLWLATAGIVCTIQRPPTSRNGYDAVVHSLFLGFTMGMILGHAPIILPAVLQVRLEWTTWFWLPAFLLEASLLVRIGIGDGLDRSAAVQAGGTVNVLSLLTLVAVIATHIQPRTRARTHLKSTPRSRSGEDHA
ncbi:hypothetical protein TPCU426_00930 [Cutibacterium acnes]|nr:hypothetical protein TIA2EST2_00455 [Cutibacterium acnes TypeIA2 P.acn33]AEW80439.1 hypothetical protein TIA2EST22_00455 [Cutibacterium acnes TypeIA2 P.acn17]AEW82703.1 hypothetical protein TIA2EST36_00470 [Cutibacterium acnes TypeIA2 P.acn31]MBM2808547.1 hypothetical protein [Cutibacterium acnes]MCW5111725.1 hypothetical protein [Cutibacterium acnes 18B]SIJ63905.1 Uncharacterised protein [Mycobacteroides abscessus subsp. abscessus]